MSHHQGDDADYMADEYEMEDGDDDMDEEFRGRDTGGSDSDVDEYDHLVCDITSKLINTLSWVLYTLCLYHFQALSYQFISLLAWMFYFKELIIGKREGTFSPSGVFAIFS